MQLPSFNLAGKTAIVTGGGTGIGQGVAHGRAGTIDDLLGTAVFLASDASDYITGELFRVDGGFTAGWYYDPKLLQ